MFAAITIVRLLQIVPAAVVSIPALAYDVIAVSGGGKIEGKVVFQGDVPTKKIIPTKNREVCGGPRDEPLILVGPDKGVEDVVVYLKEVPKGKAWGKPPKPPGLLRQTHCLQSRVAQSGAANHEPIGQTRPGSHRV